MQMLVSLLIIEVSAALSGFYFVKMAGRLLKFSRSFTTSRVLESSVDAANPYAVRSHASDVAKWKKLFFFVCIPAIIVEGVNIYLEDPPKRPEFVKYSYLRIRNKPFPWRDGVKSLFHNPHMNALPDGYETEEHH